MSDIDIAISVENGESERYPKSAKQAFSGGFAAMDEPLFNGIVYTRLTSQKNGRNPRPKKLNSGLTLLEATIALAIFMILSAGIISVWRHTSTTTARLLRHQSVFENARVSLDAILMNIQVAQMNVPGIAIPNYVHLEINRYSNRLIRLRTPGIDSDGHSRPYAIGLNTVQHHLTMGGIPFALYIADVLITPDNDENPSRIYVEIIAICIICDNPFCDNPDHPEQISLKGSVDVRYREVRVTRR